MPAKTRQKLEFGDFQTPDALARRACNVLHRLGVSPRSIIEPTCGKGAFLRASVATFPTCTQFLGFDVNPHYVREAKSVDQASVQCEDFFLKNWTEALEGLQEPICVIGNPPWVTNSAIGSIGSANLPVKSNFQQVRGIEAITGSGNFDISEWMILHLLELLSGRDAVLAMICKTAVARKVLRHAWNWSLEISWSSIYGINAAEEFGAAVDACLLVCILRSGTTSSECAVYSHLETSVQDSTLAVRDGKLLADLDAFSTYGHLAGTSPIKWRSGIKHDCSRVIELRPIGQNKFTNGLGETVELESSYLYPMLKSSEVVKPSPKPSRYMLITQQSMADDTSQIKLKAPRTWDYLQAHADWLDGRASSIYQSRPRFSMFGIGPYSFAPWKIAISGFYKRLEFRSIGTFQDKPIVLDDTCYFLPCKAEHDASVLVKLLNSRAAKGFYRSFIFWDAKRPITAQLLKSLDLGRLAEEAGVSLPAWVDGPRQGSFLPFLGDRFVADQGRIQESTIHPPR